MPRLKNLALSHVTTRYTSLLLFLEKYQASLLSLRVDAPYIEPGKWKLIKERILGGELFQPKRSVQISIIDPVRPDDEAVEEGEESQNPAQGISGG